MSTRPIAFRSRATIRTWPHATRQYFTSLMHIKHWEAVGGSGEKENFCDSPIRGYPSRARSCSRRREGRRNGKKRTRFICHSPSLPRSMRERGERGRRRRGSQIPRGNWRRPINAAVPPPSLRLVCLCSVGACVRAALHSLFPFLVWPVGGEWLDGSAPRLRQQPAAPPSAFFYVHIILQEGCCCEGRTRVPSQTPASIGIYDQRWAKPPEVHTMRAGTKMAKGKGSRAYAVIHRICITQSHNMTVLVVYMFNYLCSKIKYFLIKLYKKHADGPRQLAYF
jgi:hypothetical protein